MKQLIILSAIAVTTNLPLVAQISNTKLGSEALISNRTGRDNVAIGYRSLRANVSGSSNTVVGSDAMMNHPAGSNNSGFGYRALYLSRSGSYNTALGAFSLANNPGDGNTAVGFSAATFTAGAHFLTAVGMNALQNSSASFNTAVGAKALFNNTWGSRNVAVGVDALFQNTTGSRNTAIGDSAGARFITSNGTFLGYKAGVVRSGFVNVMALGAETFNTASNQIRLGNTSIISIGGRVGWTTLSDGRYKEDVKEDIPGIELIKKLRPVSYLINDSKLNATLGRSSTTPEIKAKRQSGFIAQEVESTAKELNYDFSAVDAPQHDADIYGLRYAEFVVPIVKGMQELIKKVEEQQAQIDEQQQTIDELKRIIAGGANGSRAWIKQNTPNPVSSSTTIEYFIPSEVRAARILVTNAKGQQLNVYNVSGSGTVQFNVGTLPAGTYTYSLVADGRTISAKKLVVVLR